MFDRFLFWAVLIWMVGLLFLGLWSLCGLWRESESAHRASREGEGGESGAGEEVGRGVER